MLYKHFSALLLVLVLSSSCTLHRAPKGLTQYQQAMLCYEAKDYYEASRLFEETLPSFRGKKEEASICFCQAYCSLRQKKYVQSSERFKFFRETFLGDARVEEAMYMQGHALYLESPNVKLDQVPTREAIHALHDYLNHYPEGTYVKDASVQLEALEGKLALKDFNNAKLYHRLAYHRAAVVTLENFQKDFPDACYNEEAAYLKVDAQFLSLKKMKGTDKEQQLGIAIKYCQEFLDKYPNGPYTLAVGKMYKVLSSASESVTKKP